MKPGSSNSDGSNKFRALILALVATVSDCISGRFCGVAIHNKQGNGWSSDALRVASFSAGASKLWHYNWLPSTDVHATGVEFVPMIKFPGQALGGVPRAGRDSVGYTMKGWNEPDDPGQAGSIHALRMNPEGYAQAWTHDMLAASAKGCTEFVGPAMAHDSCWLDHLKACDVTGRCKEHVTYLALHRYRQDCGTYVADSDYPGWREDLSYILSFYRIMRKYNRRGFQIKGLVWDEFGCLTNGFRDAAPEHHQHQYITEWYENTVIKVLTGDAATVGKIKSTHWIGASGPDAHAGQQYNAGSCRWSNGGAQAASDAVEAIRAIKSMAWANIHFPTHYLFRGSSLTALGQTYFSACSRVPGSGQRRAGAGSASVPPTRTVTDTGSGGCHTLVPSHECYKHVIWARDVGIHHHPEWYPALPPFPTFDDIQEDLWKKGHGNCPQPCMKPRTAGTGGWRTGVVFT